MHLKFIINLTSVINIFIDSISMDSNRKNLNFKNECRCHGYLTNSAQKVNSIYTILFFIWIAIIYASIIMHIYAFSTIQTDNIYLFIHPIMCALFFIFFLTVLTAVCEFTSYEVN